MEFNSSNDKVLHTYIVCSILNKYFPSFLKYAFGLPRGMLSWLLHKSLILIASNVKQRKHFNRMSATLSNFLDLAQSQILAPKSTNLKPILTRNPKPENRKWPQHAKSREMEMKRQNVRRHFWFPFREGNTLFWMVKDTYLRKISTHTHPHMSLESFLFFSVFFFFFLRGRAMYDYLWGSLFVSAHREGVAKKKNVWHNVAKCVAQQ